MVCYFLDLSRYASKRPIMKANLLPAKRIFRYSLFASLFFSSTFLWSQDGKTNVSIELKNIAGGIYTNKEVVFTKIGETDNVSSKSDFKGIAIATLDCGSRYEVNIENHTRKQEIRTPVRAGMTAMFTYTYSHDMAASDEIFAMSDMQKAALESEIKLLPDTTFVKNSIMIRPRNITNYTAFKFEVKSLDYTSLVDETVIFTGKNRNKSFKGATNERGILIVYLPKGDEYSINFLYNKNFAMKDIPFSKGTSQASSNIQYIGTKEILRRKKIEEDRIKAIEERLAKEKKEFEDWCKKEKISFEEGHKRRLEASMRNVGTTDLVVDKVLSRNNWSQKLIVCDVTGSMNPYVQQLLTWYQLNILKEKNLQFVFFNDGDNKSTSEKKIGMTGGIYYQNKPTIEELVNKVSFVQGKGGGGDGPENNMEALIKGVSLANLYKELVMVADNHAPVKDLELLTSFSKPVHIILCGASGGFIHPDYLQIAWKTKGSIHTIEEDIVKIASMLEGETIQIMGRKFKIMGGEFVQISGI